jgi:hypothetical protein
VCDLTRAWDLSPQPRIARGRSPNPSRSAPVGGYARSERQAVRDESCLWDLPPHPAHHEIRIPGAAFGTPQPACPHQHGCRGALFALPHCANEPRAVPNLHAGIDRLLVEHQHGKTASIVVRGQIDIVGLRQHVSSIAKINSVRPDSGITLSYNVSANKRGASELRSHPGGEIRRLQDRFAIRPIVRYPYLIGASS